MTDPNAPLPKVPSLAHAVRRGFRKAFVFSGRAARAEFWLFRFFWLIVTILLIIVHAIIFGPAVDTAQSTTAEGRIETRVVSSTYNGGLWAQVFNLICLPPMLAVAWRRMHDRDHAGWWILLPFIWLLTILFCALLIVYDQIALFQRPTLRDWFESPAFGFVIVCVMFAPAIYVLIQMVRTGTAGPNRFGPPPYKVMQ